MNLLFTFLVVISVGVVLGDMCTWHPTFSSTDYEYCAWGCCYSYIYPCCDTPFYSDTPFIVGMSVSGGLIIIAVLSAICYRRRRIVASTVQYTSPGTQNVFSTSTSTNVNSNFNTGYNTAVPTNLNPPPYNAAYSNPGYVRTY